MTFEEFFKKKRIDLAALEKAVPALFSEFKDHFEQMGEKSFDHTKKYWFNKLRRQYQLAPEIKTDKPHIPNPLAEQTITESLIETIAPSPKVGFTPKFRAGAVTKPPVTEDKKEEPNTSAALPESTETPSPVTPKPGFTPRFKAGNMPKPAAGTEDKQQEPVTPPAEQTVEPSAPAKPAGFVPRFKAGNIPKVTASMEEKPEETVTPPAEQVAETPAPSTSAPKLGFVPKFKAANMPKPAVAPEDKKEEIAEKPVLEAPVVETPAETTAPKTGYQPRFKMKPKEEVVENKDEEIKPADIEPQQPVEQPEPAKPAAYKPRFNMKNIPPKSDS